MMRLGPIQWGRITGTPACNVDPARRQGLRQQRRPTKDRGHGRGAQHSAQDQSALEELLLALPVSRPQRHRAHVRQDQGLSQDRNPIRQVGTKLPRRRLPRRYDLLLVMSPEPNPYHPAHRRPNPAIEPGARAPGPWCVIRNTGIGGMLTRPRSAPIMPPQEGRLRLTGRFSHEVLVNSATINGQTPVTGFVSAANQNGPAHLGAGPSVVFNCSVLDRSDYFASGSGRS